MIRLFHLVGVLALVVSSHSLASELEMQIEALELPHELNGMPAQLDTPQMDEWPIELQLPVGLVPPAQPPIPQGPRTDDQYPVNPELVVSTLLPAMIEKPEITKALAACAKAAEDYLVGYAPAHRAARRGSCLRDPGTVHADLKPSADRFDAACLSGDLDSVPTTFPARIGELLDPDGSTYCMGMIVDGSRILSARHCFAHPKGERSRVLALRRKRLLDCQFDPDRCSMRFRNLRGQTFRVSGGVNDRGSGFGLTADFVRLKLIDVFDETGLLSVRFEDSADREEPALLAAEYWLAGPYRAHPCGLESVAEPRWSARNTCFITETGDGCALHSCQTLPGFSGAPLVQWREDEFVVAGLHLGPVEPATTCNGTTGKHGNILISATELRQ